MRVNIIIEFGEEQFEVNLGSGVPSQKLADGRILAFRCASLWEKARDDAQRWVDARYAPRVEEGGEDRT